MLGDRLGKWVIFKELGRGGVGRVFLAQEEIGGRQAAIKILAGELAQEIGFLQRFKREIETLSQLSHPNIVQFYEAGYENDMYFYAMEYVEGQSLEEVLHAQKRIPWRDVLDAAIQVCLALRHVHDHGIIHRDIKPPNLLRKANGTVKLTDFGIAKVFAQSHLTATGGIVGTAEYLSPEQAAGKPATKRSDLYSLGVVLYTLLVGKTPFEGATLLDLLHKHQYKQFDRPRRILPELPHDIDDVVCQLLEKDPAKRPPDCLVLGKQLERIRNKLERKSHPTEEGVPNAATVAENRRAIELDDDLPGPGTLMSRLVREELARQNQHGMLGNLLNKGWVLAVLLILCVGTIVWAFWPPGAESLFDNGSRLMASSRPADWERAWRDYLQPLEERFPEHPYQEEVARFRAKRDAARDGDVALSEAQRFYRQAERLREEGQLQAARTVYESVVVVFKDSEADKEWVRKSEEALQALEQTIQAKERMQGARAALDRAASLRDTGKRDQAEKIWAAIETLYHGDPAAREVLAEIKKARGK